MGAFTLLVIIFMVAMAPNIVHSQCLPDGDPCRKMTDCCSMHCEINSPGHPIGVCTPSPCGCPQPIWAKGPILEHCTIPIDHCEEHEECCTGFCFITPWAWNCGYPPCQPCA